jgi:putative aldouronate transport system substrate-binding protein
MKNLLRFASIVLAIAVLFTSGLAGCGKSTTETQDNTAKVEASTQMPAETKEELKEVALKTYLLGDKPADFDAVYAEVNKLLKQKVNATMDVSFISWGDMNTKYPVIFASGEDFDLVFTASWLNYKVQASKNAYLELTDELLQKYAPKTFAEVPQDAWKQILVKGKRYTVPFTNVEFGYNVLLVRGDLREKYNIEPLKTVDDVEKYLLTVAEKEKGIIPYDVGEVGKEIERTLYTQPNGIDIYDDAYLSSGIKDSEGKLFNALEDPKYIEFVKRMYEWKKKGIIPADAAAKKSVMQDSFKAGKTAMTSWNLGICSATIKEINQTHPEWKPELVDIAPEKPMEPLMFSNNGMSIKNGSKNVERSLMVLDLLRNDKEISDLTFYGIKGKHWEPVGDDKYKAGPDAGKFPAELACPWGWFTSTNKRKAADSLPAADEINNNWKKNAFTGNPLNGFAVDTATMKTEAAALSNLKKQYLNPLTLGALEPEKYLNEYKTKAKAAGYDKYLEEASKQAKAYMEGSK